MAKTSIDKKVSDEELVKLIRDTDQELYSFIIDRYEKKLKAYVSRLTNGSMETEDLVQETLIKAFIALNSFETDKKFSSWIYRIAHNETINWLKKKKAHIILDEDKGLAGRLKADIDIHKEVLDSEQSKDLIMAISQLPDKYKEVMILKYLEGKPYEEISDIIRKPKNTVGTYINRAKKMLKKRLEKNYGEEYKK